MNIIDVALKDLKRVFRSLFALIMMFGAPLLIAGLLYFAFAGLASADGSFTLARTHIVIANLDQPSQISQFKAGSMLIQFLRNEDLKDILELDMAPVEASARSAVDRQEADVALIIPANFTQAALTPGQTAAVILYQDPTLTIGPGIVKDLVNHFMDGFSGAKIAAKVTSASAQVGGSRLDPDLLRTGRGAVCGLPWKFKSRRSSSHYFAHRTIRTESIGPEHDWSNHGRHDDFLCFLYGCQWC